MRIEDARPQIAEAVTLLLDGKNEIGLPDLNIEGMAKFLARAREMKMEREQKLLLLDQAAVVLEEFYAHLPFKRARYAVDPVQRLRLLRADMDQLDDLEFHGELVKTFSRLRDPHTFYALPRPFSGASAFLPFRIQHYYEGEPEKIRFLITHVMRNFVHETFTPGAHITHYNGMPVEEAVWHEAGFDSAGNEDAQFIRGLNALFGRALGHTAPREEHWAVVQYLPAAPNDAEELGILLPWQVMSGLRPAAGSGGARSSIFSSQLQTLECRKALWGWRQLAEEKYADDTYRPNLRRFASVRTDTARAKKNETRLPALFSYTATVLQDDAGEVKPSSLRDAKRADAEYGYLRIASFHNEDTNEFLEEARRILNLMNEIAGDGLVLDVRSNPGGNINAAEGLLQMLTPRDIQPAQFHFMNSKTTRDIALQLAETKKNRTAAVQQFDEWKEGLIASLAEGSTLTPGRPLTRPAEANKTGQVYQGPVVLLIDALSYSATDIFAAGFEDNEIGPILGVDRNTGGGGANRWLHDELRENTQNLANMPLRELPAGANFGVAIRRTTRVGKNLGDALEDVGVQCGEKHRHRRTRRDLEEGDCDLLLRACQLVSDRPSYWLKIDKVKVLKKCVRITMQAIGLDRIECFLDGFPQMTIAVTRDKAAEAKNRRLGMGVEADISTEALARRPSRVKVKGYTKIDNDEELNMRLVAANDFRF